MLLMNSDKFIPWNNQLSVKVEEIDKQHQELIQIINQLYDTMIQRRGTEQIPEILERLEMYTVSHFSTEEALMRIFGYPEYQKHKEQHNQLVRELQHIRQNITDGEFHHVNSELLIYLRNWLLQHIMKADQHLGIYLEKQGIGKNKPWYKRFF